MRHVASRSAGVVAPKDKEEGADGEAAIAGETEEQRLESLYEQIAWPVGKKYGHPYDAFKLALT
jgi:translation initiation factor 2 subunit 1